MVLSFDGKMISDVMFDIVNLWLFFIYSCFGYSDKYGKFYDEKGVASGIVYMLGVF